MALTVRQRIEAELSGERQEEFRNWKTRVYWLGRDATLAQANLEQGDTLPDDSSYEIITSALKHAKEAGTYAVCQGYTEDTTSGSPWSELDGTRTVDDLAPNHIDFIITFTAATGTTAPVPGNNYSAVFGSGTLGMASNYDDEPRAIHVSEVVKATKNKSHVTVRFRAHYWTEERSSRWAEIHPRIKRRIGKSHWRCRRRFSCAAGREDALEDSLYHKAMPGYSGKYAPMCEEVQSVTGFKRNRSLVTADYETQRVPGEATIEVMVSHQYETVTREPLGDERVIVGPEDGDKQYMHHYEVVSGSNKIMIPRAVMVIKTAYDRFDVDSIMGRVGHVNNATAFGLRAGSLLLIGAPAVWKPRGQLWYIDYQFAYSGPIKLWNWFLTVQLYVNGVRELPVVDVNGAFDPNRPVAKVPVRLHWSMSYDPSQPAEKRWTKADDSLPEEREIFPSADFSELDGWIEW